MTPIELTPDDAAALDVIQKAIPGWSNRIHQGFFKMLLAEPSVHDILMLGVYHGRDIAIILDLARRYRPDRKLTVWGVDKFSDTPCADWPKERTGLSWRAAGFGEPPADGQEIADKLKVMFPPANREIRFTINRADDAEFIAHRGNGDFPPHFDAAYLDTAHDYHTVKRQCLTVPKICRPGAIICGDDYSDGGEHGTWGVVKAVTEVFPDHKLFGHWIWVAEPTK